MTVRPCLPWPNPILRTKAALVPEITDEIRAIWADMVDTMEAMPGVGLAAPQIGVGLQLAVVDASQTRDQVILMANPTLLHVSGESVLGTEASPNLPGVSAKIKRPKSVTVRFLNQDGVIERRDLIQTWARSCQHQIDHLNGKMFFDNLSRVKRDMLLRKARKA